MRRSPASATSARASSRFKNEPVGLFGLTTTMARVPRRQRAAHLLDVDEPAAVIAQRIGRQAHALERGELIEQRIARRRHEHVVAGIAEQLEQPGVGLRRRRRQRDALGIDGDAVALVVRGDGGARRRQAARRRLVDRTPPARRARAGWRRWDSASPPPSGSTRSRSTIGPRARAASTATLMRLCASDAGRRDENTEAV